MVSYSQAADSLFRHPDWATGVVTQSATLDSVRGDLTFEIPSFGTTTKAVLLVVTLEDGPSGYYSSNERYGEVSDSFQIGVGATLTGGTTPIAAQGIATSLQVESEAAWSPDGARIAYRKVDASGNSRIFLRAADGTGSETPLRSASAGQVEPSWSARTNTIAYTEVTDTTGRSIYSVDVATGAAQLLTGSGTYAHEPAFSPNGGRLAYLRDWRVSPGGDHDPPRDGTSSQAITAYGWDVRVHELSTGADSLLAQFSQLADDGPGELRGLRWSPDGRFLTFSKWDVSANLYHLYQVDVQTRSLTMHDAQAPAARTRELSPGSGPMLTEEAGGYPYATHCDPVAFAFCNCSPLDGVAIAPADWMALRDTTQATSSPIAYRSGARFTLPRWSPDGTRIAYTTTQNGNPDVYVIAPTLNRAPVMASSVLSSYSFSACDGAFDLTLAATDPDGDAITYQVFDLPAGAGFQTGHQIYWPAPVVGDHWFIARALDAAGAVATRLVHVNVYDGGGCGGGGGEDPPGDIMPGGQSLRRVGSDALIHSSPEGAGPRAVNSFLDGAASGEWITQISRLVAAVADTEGHVRTRLVALRPGVLEADRARLLVVDHVPGTVAVATPDGIAVGARRWPTHLALSDGENLTGRLCGSLEDAIHFATGTELLVDFTATDSLVGVVVDCARSGAIAGEGEWGVRVELPDGDGWHLAGRIHPRSGYDGLAVAVEGGTHVRLVFASDVDVRSIAGYSLAGGVHESATITPASCMAANVEAGVSALATADSSGVRLTHGEGVTMQFDGPSLMPGLTRSYFLDLVASFTPETSAQQASGVVGETALPARFALFANRPNPFGGGTAIRFEVPRSAPVRIEVFDAQGRRVRTLADHLFEPGVHSVSWDGTDSIGRRAEPGVYLYRMTSTGYSEQKRMVLLGR